MNISGTSQSKSIETQYISSNGNRKTLKSTNDCSVKAIAVKTLSEFECQICFDVHEKPLQTRCCESVICASCYLFLPSPKKCPSDRADFTGSIREDLKVAGRLINNQIVAFVANFNDVQSTGTDTEKSEKQNDAIMQIKSGSSQASSTSQSGSTSQRSSNNSRISQSTRQNVEGASYRGLENLILGLANISLGGDVNISLQDSSFDSEYPNVISGGSIHIGGGGSMSVGNGGITVNGRRIQGDNLVFRNGQLVSGQNVTITGADQASRSNPIRTHDFTADDVIFIDVHTRMGDIAIEGQHCGNQEKVSIKSSKQPRLTGNVLSLDCDETVSIRVPELFSRNLKLHTDMGNILTKHGYSIKSGGNLHSNMGNVDIKVDSMLVKAKGKTNMGSKSIRVGNHSADWERQVLLAQSNMGNVHVYD